MANGTISTIQRWKRNNMLRTVRAGKVDCPACNGVEECSHCDNGFMPLEMALTHPALRQVTQGDIEQYHGRGR